MGFTLLEVLVAMSILLVGIWTVAAGFPQLFGVLTHEEKRTEMSRLLEATVEQFKTDRDALPLAITGGPAIHPDSVPEDPDMVLGPVNSRDDILWVVGENFVVPATQMHVLNVGLAQGWEDGDPPLADVYEIRQVTEGDELSVDTQTGDVTINDPNYDAIEVSYVWRDDLEPPGVVHYVHGEVVPHPDNGFTLYAIQDAHQTVVQGSVQGIGEMAFGDVVYNAPGGSWFVPQESEQVALDYGAVLRFHADDVGRTVRVNYQLRTAVDPLRAGGLDLIMAEDRQLSVATGKISLVGTGIDTAQPLFEPNTYIMAVDLDTGQIYEQGVGFDFETPIDYGRGLLTLDFLNPLGVLGHTFRFYYRTTDQDMITVQKTPRLFLEDLTAPAEEAYRTYSRLDTNLLQFAPCAAGQTVAVDYTYGAGQLASGQVHTINANDYTITLKYANVQSIIAVRGMSLKVRAWWRTQSGGLAHEDVDTILGLTPVI